MKKKHINGCFAFVVSAEIQYESSYDFITTKLTLSTQHKKGGTLIFTVNDAFVPELNDRIQLFHNFESKTFHLESFCTAVY